MKLNFTGNPRIVQGIIVALVVLTSWFGCREVKAEEPKFLAGGGVLTVSDVKVAHALRVGMETGPWQVSIVTHGDDTIVRDDVPYYFAPNMGACGTWGKALSKWSIGWGACLWEHGDWAIGDKDVTGWNGSALTLNDDGIQLTANIVVRRCFGERQRVCGEFFHASTGGSTHYNRGKNFFFIGARI